MTREELNIPIPSINFNSSPTRPDLERAVVFSPAWDRSSTPGNYGKHCVDITWYVRGAAGAVQFNLFTGWYPEIIKPTSHTDWSDWAELHIDSKKFGNISAPTPADLGYHARKPQYDDQSARPNCMLLDGDCYYDGSGLNASKPFSILVHEGGDALWEFLENYYKDTFEVETFAG